MRRTQRKSGHNPFPWEPDEPVKPDPRQLKLIPETMMPPPPVKPRHGCGTPLSIGTCGSDPAGIGCVQLCRPCYAKVAAQEVAYPGTREHE